jgi:hypothetical protein
VEVGNVGLSGLVEGKEEMLQQPTKHLGYIYNGAGHQLHTNSETVWANSLFFWSTI